jgi:transcriptional regulator NrdR family protein
MIRCPSCDSTDTANVARIHFDDGQAADRRECSACGEQWMVPVVASAVEPDEIEAIELRGDDGPSDDSTDGVEEWLR